eukprot:23214-Rhodomonas_salina.3
MAASHHLLFHKLLKPWAEVEPMLDVVNPCPAVLPPFLGKHTMGLEKVEVVWFGLGCEVEDVSVAADLVDHRVRLQRLRDPRQHLLPVPRAILRIACAASKRNT